VGYEPVCQRHGGTGGTTATAAVAALSSALSMSPRRWALIASLVQPEPGGVRTRHQDIKVVVVASERSNRYATVAQLQGRDMILRW
jgi:hypothetical protein